MQVLEFNEKKGILKIKVEDEDDLWILNYSLEKGDRVIARTTRDVSLGNEARRIPIIVELEVEKTEFQAFTSRLRIHGVILDAPERYGIKGSHHTINLDIGDEIVIIKGKWKSHILSKIFKKAEKRFKVLIAIVDFDEFLIAVPMLQGIKILEEKSLRSITKEEDVIEKNAEEIAKIIKDYSIRLEVDAVIIAGPGPFKEIVNKKLDLKNKKVYLDSVSSATRAGLNELLRRDIITQVVRDYELSEAQKIYEKFMEELAKGSKLVGYGIEEIKNAAIYNAVSSVLVLEDLLGENREIINNILDEIEKRNGRVYIIPRDSPIYYQVKSLGGIIALLRFPIY
ncbi:MAG: mRNA surveillance protein pelota [Sulfolobaceae archaeon]